MKKSLTLSLFVMFLLGISNVSAQNCQGQFKTFTIGGWGTTCSGNNPGCYRDANFEAAFPDGITIGCGENTLSFTSSQAVEDFLPSGGTPALLSGVIVDAAGSINNTLASQVLAVALAAGFDAYDADFSSSTTGFGSLPILSGAHAGMTVAEFLAYANQVIGGCVEGDLSDLNATATAINENYDNGTVDQGYLDCNSNRSYDIQITSNVTCHGYLNGAVTVTVTGGLAPYHFELFKDAISVAASGSVENNSYQFTGLGAGTYTAIVTDANGVVSSGPAQFNVLEPVAISASVSGTVVSCFGGSNGTATINSAAISGGVGPYTFAWANGSTDSTITGLTAGSYTVTVTDSLGCAVDFSVIVNQPTLLSSSSSITNVTCFGANNGSATITPAGGTAPYTILWDNQSISFIRGSLAPGVNYTAVITDAKGCTTNVSVSVTQPTVLSVATVRTQVLCYGGTGTGTATPAGGTAPYSYSWNTNPVQTSATAYLPVGTWTVRVTDANGCTVSSSVTLTLQSCQGFTTVTPGGYGAACSGGNWGCYLASNFASKFPTGLQIGSGTRFLKFTTAAAVKAFLPSGTTPRALNAGTLTNPTAKSYSNVLAGHTIALTLSLGFDTNPAFSPSTTSLGSLVVSSGVFAGKSVIELLTIANTFLGGGATAYTADQINTALDAVNRNYDNGTSNLGYLSCPCNLTTKTAAAPISADAATNFVVYPNPVRGNATVEFTLGYASYVTMVIYNINGQKVSEIYHDTVNNQVQQSISFSTNGLKAGVYLLKVTTDRETVTKSLLISQ